MLARGPRVDIPDLTYQAITGVRYLDILDELLYGHAFLFPQVLIVISIHRLFDCPNKGFKALTLLLLF